MRTAVLSSTFHQLSTKNFELEAEQDRPLGYLISWRWVCYAMLRRISVGALAKLYLLIVQLIPLDGQASITHPLRVNSSVFCVQRIGPLCDRTFNGHED